MVLSEFIIWFTNWAAVTIGAYGYLGVFLVSLVSHLSILFPVPGFAVVFTLGAVLNPFLVAVVAALGGTIGEISGYALGRGGKSVKAVQKNKYLKKFEDWAMRRRGGMFILLVVFAATPLPQDILGILAGIIKYDIKKFLLATLIGLLILNLYVAYIGSITLGAIEAIPGI